MHAANDHAQLRGGKDQCPGRAGACAGAAQPQEPASWKPGPVSCPVIPDLRTACCTQPWWRVPSCHAPKCPFPALFSCRLQDYPEHRLQFFSLLRAITNHCSATLFAMSPVSGRDSLYSFGLRLPCWREHLAAVLPDSRCRLSLCPCISASGGQLLMGPDQLRAALVRLRPSASLFPTRMTVLALTCHAAPPRRPPAGAAQACDRFDHLGVPPH